MRGHRLLLLLVAGVATAQAGSPPVPLVRPVVLEGRVVARLPAGGPWMVDVERTLNGWVPSTTILVIPGPEGRDLPGPGRRVHLVVVPDPDGSYRTLGARDLPEVEPPLDPLPEPIALLPDPSEAGARASAKAGPSVEQQVVELVNQERWDNGQLPPLKQAAELHACAGDHSSNMALRDFFAHCDPDTGTLPWDRMTAAGYYWSWAGENIAAGYSSPTAVMAGWMASSGHRANILSTSFREIGVGYAYQSGDLSNVREDANGDCVADTFNKGPYYSYWTQTFGTRSSVYPVVIDREAYETATAGVDLYVYGEGWADDMRFSNDGVAWSSWEPYNPNRAWNLAPGNGLKTVYAQIRRGATVLSASDTILLAAECTGPDTIELTDQTISTTQTWEACIQISAGPAVTVVASGDATFRAPTVILRNGFSVLTGAELEAGD